LHKKRAGCAKVFPSRLIVLYARARADTKSVA
jgi:hypothetical protein